MSPFDVTLAVSILVLGAYALVGLRLFDSNQSYSHFFLADRDLTTENVRNTFAGAAISVSTVLSFFLTLGVAFGYQIFWSPITLAFGVLVFAHVIHPRIVHRTELFVALQGKGERPIDSLPELVEHFYGSRVLTTAISLLSAAGVLAILVAEMMVGVSIYSEYFLRPEYVVFIMAATLFLYAGFGGLRAVVETDRWQVRLIAIGLTAVVAALMIQEFTTTDPASPGFKDIGDPATWSPSIRMPLALFVNIMVVNLSFLPSSLRVWQVLVASTRRARFKIALWQATGIILFITLISVLISRVMLGIYDETVTLPRILSHLATSGSSVLAFVVYPLFIVALLSALVSTADSAIIPLAQLMSRKEVANWRVFRSWLSILALLIGTIVVYFVVTDVFGLGLVSWILTVFSITTCIAPVVVMPLFFARKRISTCGLALIEVGTIGGFIAAIVWSVYFGDDLTVQPWNCVIGFGISSVLTILGLGISPGSNTAVNKRAEV